MRLRSAFSHGECRCKCAIPAVYRFVQSVARDLPVRAARIIESLGRDGKGKRLEGSTVTFLLHGCDKRAEVTDQAAVPAKYKRITITMPVESWELVCDSLELDLT